LSFQDVAVAVTPTSSESATHSILTLARAACQREPFSPPPAVRLLQSAPNTTAVARQKPVDG
jgi:hypothetical protein